MKLTASVRAMALASVRSVAKAIALRYSRLGEAYPHLAKQELLLKTLKRQCPYLTDAQAERMVIAAGHRLEYVICEILWEEHPGWRRASTSSRLVYADMLDTVKKMVDAHAPGA